jgi:Ulp1 family protease
VPYLGIQRSLAVVPVQVMDAATALIADRLAAAGNAPEVISFVSSFFITRLEEQGYDEDPARRWARRRNLDFCAERVFFNVHAGRCHWVLIEVEGVGSSRPFMKVYDSAPDLETGTPEIVAVRGSLHLCTVSLCIL